jgi:hypothetical protein
MASQTYKLDSLELLEAEAEERETDERDEEMLRLEEARWELQHQRRLALTSFVNRIELEPYPEPSPYDLTEFEFDEIVAWQVPGFIGRRDN